MEMQFCPYCGTRLDEGARFCKNCGESINKSEGQSNTVAVKSELEQAFKRTPTAKKIVYEGTIHKCLNCGETLDAFSANCPACGQEVRSRQVVESVQELTRKLELIDAIKIDDVPPEKRLVESNIQERQKQLEKINLIQNFPIPNTREDIIEFLLLAASNINEKNNIPELIFETWVNKLDQVYQKALIVLGNSSDLNIVRDIYKNAQAVLQKKQKQKKIKAAIAIISKSLFVIVGIIMFIVAIIIDKLDGNSFIYKIIGTVLLIASAATLSKRGATYLDILTGAGSGGLSFFLAGLLDNGSMLKLCGVVVLIISADCYFKKLENKEL